MKDFHGKVAVITGAGSGIGRALALALRDEGSELALVDVHEARLRAVQAEIGATRATIHVADVADRKRMAALADEVMAQHDRVDILINNAGVSVGADLEDHSLEDFDWIVGINFWGVVHGCKFFLPHLRRSDDAYIVNLSSMFGLIGIPGQSSYCATKFAVRGFSEAIAAELAETNVRVMSVHPGGIRTNIAKDTRISGAMASGHERVVEYFERRAMPPEKCAEKIVSAMRKGKSRLLVAPEAFATDVIKRLFPSLPQRWIARARRALLPK
jgi:NADP-dependent 3-hydroxy acid dehydrogenase YdfG